MDQIFLEKIQQTAPSLQLTSENKAFLLNVCRVTLENRCRSRRISSDDFAMLPKELNTTDSTMFVTFYQKGKVRACMGNSSSTKNLIEKAIDATENSIKDTRFNGKLKISELDSIYIDITLLANPQKVDKSDLDKLKQQIELGVHSLRIQKDGKHALFKSSVPIAKQFSLKRTLRSLGKKAGLGVDAYKESDVDLYRYDTIQFAEKMDARFNRIEVCDKYRSHSLVLPSSVNKRSLENSLQLAGDYLKNHVSKSGKLTYEYDPIEDKRTYSGASVAVLRRLASTWILAEVGNYFHDASYVRAAKRSAEYMILNNYTYDEEKNFGYLLVQKGASIGSAGFLLLGLLAIDDPTFYPEVKQGLEKFILNMEDLDKGFLYPVLLPNKMSGFAGKQLYYPGEAMTALMALYEKEGNKEILKTPQRVFNYYYNLFQETDKKINMAAWMSKPYGKLFQFTQDQKYADFVFEINDFVVSKQYGLDKEYIDKIGGFSSMANSCSAGVFLESIAEGLNVAKLIDDQDRVEKYTESLILGMRLILQNQIAYHDDLHGKNLKYALGGMRTSIYDPNIRADNVQHCACALIKTLTHVDLQY